jgi:hypothetical protein
VLRLVERLRWLVERVPVELLRVRLLAVRRVLLVLLRRVPPLLLRRVLLVLLRRVPLVVFWVAMVLAIPPPRPLRFASSCNRW